MPKNQKPKKPLDSVIVHITPETSVQALATLFTVVDQAASALMTGIAAVRSEASGLPLQQEFERLRRATIDKATALLQTIEKETLADALLTTVASASIALEAYTQAIDDMMDKHKDPSTGKYPCGHSDEEHEKLQKVPTPAELGGMTGAKRDQ